jgi:hypothetical protein
MRCTSICPPASPRSILPTNSVAGRRCGSLRQTEIELLDGREPGVPAWSSPRSPGSAQRCIAWALCEQINCRAGHDIVHPNNQLSFRNQERNSNPYLVLSSEPKGATNDEIQTDGGRRGRFLCAGGTRDGPPRNLRSEPPRPEHLLCDQGSGKSPQQVLRLHRLVQMAAARRLGQLARQCLLA